MFHRSGEKKEIEFYEGEIEVFWFESFEFFTIFLRRYKVTFSFEFFNFSPLSIVFSDE